jgi:hypothetical protein
VVELIQVNAEVVSIYLTQFIDLSVEALHSTATSNKEIALRGLKTQCLPPTE